MREAFDKGLGRVLMIDEAYRLAEQSAFAQEAVGEIVDSLTKPRYAGKLIVILCGYEHQINELLQVNPGLSRRFPETIKFEPLSAKDSMVLLLKRLSSGKRTVDISAVESADVSEKQIVLDILDKLSKTPNWGNTGSIENLAKKVFTNLSRRSKGVPKTQKLKLGMDVLLHCVRALEKQEDERNSGNKLPKFTKDLPAMERAPLTSKATNVSISSKTDQKAADNSPKPETPTPLAHGRDDGVSDATWNELQFDRLKADALAKDQAAEIGRMNAAISKQTASYVAQEAKRKRLEKEYEEMRSKVMKDEEEKERLRLEYEAEKKRQEEIRQEEERKIREYEEAKRKIEEARKQEAAIQKKIADMGLCVAGFRWIKQAGGYRCGGGSHFLSDSQLGI